MDEQKTSALKDLMERWRTGTFGAIFTDWKWIFSYTTKYWKAVLFYTLSGVLSTALGLVGSVAGKELIDIITGRQTDRLAALIILVLGSALISLVFDNLVTRISAKLSIRIHNDIQADIFGKIMDADWLAISGFSNGDILNRFNADVTTISSNAVSWLPNIVIALFRFAATFCVIWHYDHVMALIALASAPFLLLLSRMILKKQRIHVQTVRQAGSDLMGFESETFYNLDTIKSFGAGSQYGGKLRFWQEKYKKATLDYNLFTIKTNVLMTLAGLAVQFAALGYCLLLLWGNAITFGTMTLFLQQRSSLTSAFNSLVSVVPAFLNCSVSAGRIRELTELPREPHMPESTSLDGLTKDGFALRMDGVSFSYVEGTQVITGSDFQAHPGQIVALVGPSGEGKTTLIRLLLGLVRPQQGQAVIVASDGRQVALNVETRHLFAYVPQGNTILSGTIADNLRMVKEDATEDEMIQALKTACAWEFVEKMPGGLYASVGERGRGLSEGQAQRVAIARAVLRNAPILLLDEATSALDVATERRVLKSVMRSAPNKTCIVTTHRPSVLNLCSRVYRVVDSRVTALTEEESSRMVMEF